VIKKRTWRLLFHDKQVLCSSINILEEVFNPTGAGIPLQYGFAGFITQSENISFENMKKRDHLRV
jgi:hypothetical protein